MSLDSYTEEELQAELKRRDEQRRILSAMNKDHRLAILLHDALCRWNHTDGCGWFYEVQEDIHDWRKRDHQVWLKKSRAALKVLDDPDLILAIVKAVR